MTSNYFKKGFLMTVDDRGGLRPMMTIDDKGVGGGGGENHQNNDDVIYDSSLSFTGTFLSFFLISRLNLFF